MKHVITVHPRIARESIANRVIAHVPHMQRARRIRQHLEYVVFLFGRIGLSCVKRGVLLPALEPLALDALRIVTLVVRVVRRTGPGHSRFGAVGYTVGSFFSGGHMRFKQ